MKKGIKSNEKQELAVCNATVRLAAKYSLLTHSLVGASLITRTLTVDQAEITRLQQVRARR